MGFLDKIDNVSGSNVIKKVNHWRSSKERLSDEILNVIQDVKRIDTAEYSGQSVNW